MFGLATASENDITIKIDGNTVKAFDANPYIDSIVSRTMVPATL